MGGKTTTMGPRQKEALGLYFKKIARPLREEMKRMGPPKPSMGGRTTTMNETMKSTKLSKPIKTYKPMKQKYYEMAPLAKGMGGNREARISAAVTAASKTGGTLPKKEPRQISRTKKT